MKHFLKLVAEEPKLRWAIKVGVLLIVCIGGLSMLENSYKRHLQGLQIAEVFYQMSIKQQVQAVEKQKTAAVHYQKLLSGVALKPLPEMLLQPTQFLETLYQWTQQTTNKLNRAGITDESDGCYGFAAYLKESQVPEVKELVVCTENKVFIDFLLTTLISTRPQSIQSITCSSDQYDFVFLGSLSTFDAWVAIIADSPLPLILDAFSLNATADPSTIAVSLKRQAVLPKLQTYYNRYTESINCPLQLNLEVVKAVDETIVVAPSASNYRIQFKGYYNLGKTEADNQLILYDQESCQWMKGKVGQYFPELGVRIISMRVAPSSEGIYTNKNFILTLWDDRLQNSLEIEIIL